MITGFIVPASRSARTRRPGSAPMYVRRWPRISASSRTPPSDMRTNSRPVALAIDLPSEVLPTPGGPTRHRIGPAAGGPAEAQDGARQLVRPLLYGEVLDDPLLDLLETKVVVVEHRLGAEQ